MHRLLVSALLAFPGQLAAQQTPTTTVSTRPVAEQPAAAGAAAPAYRTEAAPVIDGRDDDPAWQHAATIDDFHGFDPVEGAEPRFRTEARVAYDERNLYVLVRMYDAHPDSIVGLLSRRDVHTPSDWIFVGVDSYHDRRTGYVFAVNPAGVKMDSYIFNDGEEDDSWDGVWDAAARVDSLGWVAELRVPLSQLRFPPGTEHTFGFAMKRDIARLNESVVWPQLSKKKAGNTSQWGDLAGLAGLGSPRRLEVTPYTVTKNTTKSLPDGRYGRNQLGTAGADIKYGVTSNLTLDATINPDFGQVEADPAQLNLTAYETFFQEKRPFFLEGTGIFRFDLNCNDGMCSGLF